MGKTKTKLAIELGVSRFTINTWTRGISSSSPLSDLIGAKHGRLLVIDRYPVNKGKHAHFVCQCDCGKQVIVDGTKIRNGHTKSCGCYALENRRKPDLRKRLPDGIAMRNRILSNYKRSSKNRGMIWGLTDEEAISLFQGNCHYCGTPPNLLAAHKQIHSPYLYNGIDRKNNELGYTQNNSVSCCQVCNYKKGDQSYESFIAWVTKVCNYIREKT